MTTTQAKSEASLQKKPAQQVSELLAGLQRKRKWMLSLFAVGASMSWLIACGLGAFEIAPERVLTIIFAKLQGSLPEELPADAAVLLGIRLPRTLFALVIGAGLGVAGAVLQGLFRNPLADPGLIGVSSGAAAGAVVMLYITPNMNTQLAGLSADSLTAAGALLGGLTSVFFVYRLSTRAGYTSTVSMLLFGIAINTITGAGIGVFVYAADEARLRSITLWMMGSLASADWRALALTSSVTAACLFSLLRIAEPLNAFTLGEAQAVHLGVPVSTLKRKAILWCTLAVAVGVAFSGMIGFIGLVIPHLSRLILGPDHRAVLPASALLGAALLVLADTLARTVVSPAELPIGLVTSIIGAPFLIFLLMQKKEVTST